MITVQSPRKFSQLDSSIRNISTIYTPLKGQDNTRAKKLNSRRPGIVGYILTIGQSIATVLAPQKPQKVQQTMTLPKSKNYWKGQKLLSQQQSRNSRHQVNPPAQPYELVYVPNPPKQVRFLLHPYQMENNLFRYHPKLELPHPVPQHLKPACPRDLYKLPHLSQLHHNCLQAIHHLTHPHLQPWLNRINPDSWEHPQTHTTAPLIKPLPFGTPLPIITPSMMVFMPQMPRRSHLPLPTLR